MGCPYDARLAFGIVIDYDKGEELEKIMHEDKTLTQDDYFEIYRNEYNEDTCYIELSRSYGNSVDSCEFASHIDLEAFKKDEVKAKERFIKSSILTKHFKEGDVGPILICKYTG